MHYFHYADFNRDRLADIIHRGRDHGLPTYKHVREFCGLTPITTFKELNTTIDDNVIDKLQRTYQVGNKTNYSCLDSYNASVQSARGGYRFVRRRSR
jgi:hypothetical protein